MPEEETTTGSEAETEELARRLAESLRSGAVLALTGDLGSGKTRFVRGLARGLEVRDPRVVTSPTFVLMQIYPGRLPLIHIDLYRVEGIDLEDLALSDLAPGAVTAIEWADRAAALPPETIRVEFTNLGGNTRRIRMSPPVARSL